MIIQDKRPEINAERQNFHKFDKTLIMLRLTGFPAYRIPGMAIRNNDML
jgi:hypothetical protein